MKKLIIFLIGVLFLCTYCKREKDTITTHNLKGIVFNNCTDSGLANVTVYLRNGNKILQSTVSETNGNFSFNNAEIHSSSKYKYNIYIESKSGGISSNPALTEIGIEGTAMYFKHDEADVFFKPRVKPKYLICIFNFQTLKTTKNDSITFKMSQNIYHKNDPSGVYTGGGGTAAYGDYLVSNGNNLVTYSVNTGNYPMGKYIIEMDIWKTSVHTTRKDSIYLGWGANTTYTINW
jgi:hypothetical protein